MHPPPPPHQLVLQTKGLHAMQEAYGYGITVWKSRIVHFRFSVVLVVSIKAREDWGKIKEELWMNATRTKDHICKY